MSDNPFEAELARRAAAQAANPFEAEIARRASSKAPEPELPELRTAMQREIGEMGGYQRPLTPDDAPIMKKFETIRAVTLPRSTAGKFDAIKKANPDAQIRFTDAGVPVVKIDGKEYAINKKGFSEQDLTDLVIEVAPQIPLTMLGASAGNAVLGGLGRVIGAGAGAGVASIGRDLAGSAVGSEQGIDAVNAAISAGTTAAFEAVVPALINYAGRVIQQEKFYKGDTLTKAGKAALKKAGIDADALTPEFIDQLKTAQATSAEQMAVAQSKSLPVQVPLSKGQVTRDVAALGEESAALKGAREGLAPGSQAIARGFDESQQAALRANVPAIQKVLTGADDIAATPAEALGAVQTNLSAIKESARAEVNAAYTAAREGGASVTSEAYKGLGKFINNSFRESFNPATAPKAAALVQEFDNFAARLPGELKAVTVRSLENWRQQVAALARSSDPVEATAAGNMTRAFDEYMTTMLDEAAVRGDSAVIAAFKNARELRRTFAQNFEADEIVKRIVDSERGQLVLQPSEAVSELFAGSAIGAKRGSANAIAQLKKLLPAEDFAKLKEAAFLRLAEAASKGGEVGTEMTARFSGAEFRRVVDNAFRQSPELMGQLFSKSEQALIRNFRDVAARATTAPAGAVNTSNSAVALERMLGRMGFLGQIARDTMKTAISPIARQRALSTVSESFSYKPGAPVVSIPPGAVGAAGISVYDLLKDRNEQ
jgi:hypothetical protein